MTKPIGSLLKLRVKKNTSEKAPLAPCHSARLLKDCTQNVSIPPSPQCNLGNHIMIY